MKKYIILHGQTLGELEEKVNNAATRGEVILVDGPRQLQSAAFVQAITIDTDFTPKLVSR